MTMDYKASVNAPDPIMPSEIPDVHIDYKGLIDYANEKGVAVSELSKEEKNQFVHDFDEIKEQNIKQQKIGQQIMAVRMIQNENKKQSSSGLTIEMLCQGMACSQEEVKKLVDYTMSFDRRFIADEVVKLCQKKELIDFSPEEICYYTWFLQMFGPQCIDKESVHQISDKPDMVNTMYLKKFTYSIPKSVGDKNKFMKKLEVCQQYLQNSISVAQKDGIKEEVIQQMMH